MAEYDGIPKRNLARIAVLGYGSWGATLAWLLHGAGHEVRIWGRSAERLDQLRWRGHPPGVPELKLPALHMTAELLQATNGCHAVVLALSSQAVAAVAAELGRLPAPPPLVVIASKGLDLESLRPLSDVAAEKLPRSAIAVVSGPCIAREVASGAPTTAVAACADPLVAERLQGWMATPRFRVYRSTDVLGVELGGALKNVIAIAAGVSDGLGLGANAKSALITRGLAEMRRLSTALGADDLTITGLAGLGDLCATCFSPHSRNRRFGEALAHGEDPAAIEERFGEVVEGVATARAVVRLCRERQLEAPVAEAVVELLEGRWKPADAVEALMQRELKAEF